MAPTWRAVPVLFILVAGAFAGCIGEPDPIRPFVVDDVHGFEAVVETSSGTGVVTLEGPVDVLVAADRWFKAYRLHFLWPQDEGDDVSATHFLDRDLREVASWSGCGYHPDACEHFIAWDWYRQGALPPRGLGFPNLIHAGDLSDHRGSIVLDVEWEVVPSSTGRLALRTSEPGVLGQVLQNEYAYTQGRLLPDAKGWKVTSYDATFPLPLADRLPFPPNLPDPAAWQGMMFPGEDDDAFALGLSHADVVRRVFPDFDSNETTCVGVYQWRLFQPDPPTGFLGLVPPLLNERETIGWVHVGLVEDGADRRRTVEVWRDSEGELRFDVQGENATGGSRCDTVRRSPWPSMTFEDGLVHARTLVDGGNLTTFAFLSIAGSIWDADPESGWHTFKFGFEPQVPTGTNYAYEVEFRPTPGKAMWSALVAPDEGFAKEP